MSDRFSPEFELLGHQFDGRGERSDDALRAIRASWGVREPVYRGSHFEYSGFVVDPSGLPRPLDIWVGGRTRRSLRRAIELGDAWIPFRLKVADLRAILDDPEVKDAHLAARAAVRSDLPARSSPRSRRAPLIKQSKWCADSRRWARPA